MNDSGNLQRRIQRYGWDLAALQYESSWQAQLAGAQAEVLACASFKPGECVVDVACGTGLVTLQAARAVGAQGHVLGVDISERMLALARHRAQEAGLLQVSFERMDAESLSLQDGSVDAAVCALGLMYMPDPARALREMRRVVRPGGRVVLAVWGERSACGWASVFPIVDAEVRSDVCPLFFHLGGRQVLSQLCRDSGLSPLSDSRLPAILEYDDADQACRAAFIGGPAALAWSRFADDVRQRVQARYVESIDIWRTGAGYRIPGEFVVVKAAVPDDTDAARNEMR